ncbi:MAG TPA: hypothetical protein VHO48_11645 [Anaerolineaceae bacterium]|nr:hypothetical protein [Anaerolineaceae bacterium]
MAKIRCHYLDCVFLDDGYCSAAAIELDPDTGCATYSPNAEAATSDEWDDEEEELEEWEELEGEDDEEDQAWIDEEEEEY